MKKYFLFFFFIFFTFKFCYAQQDSVHALFNKKPVLSFMSWDMGYTALPYKNTMCQGFSYHFGLVLSNVSIGLGIDHAIVNNIFLSNLAYVPLKPQLDYNLASFDLEYVIKPNKLINFSIPVRICWGFSSYQDIAFRTPSQSSTEICYDNFFVAEAGANIFLNVFKWISLGVGGMYRYAYGVETISNNADFSGLSMNAFLRLKLCSKEWRDRQLKKQQEWMKMYQQKP